MILDEIVAFKKLQIENEKKVKPLEEIIKKLSSESRIVSHTENFKAALVSDGISIIAEIKKASPSKGIIKEDFDAVKIGQIYEKLNIDAVSILTEKHFFKGNDDYIPMLKKVLTKPILRKDFIIDEYQIYQSKLMGADAVLLIAAVLGNRLKEFYEKARKLGIECLTEIHNREELDIAMDAGCSIIGINNRNLNNFTVDLKTTEKLIGFIPKNVVTVSESGIKTADDIKALRKAGINAVLIGETFMRNVDHMETMRNFISQVKEI